MSPFTFTQHTPNDPLGPFRDLARYTTGRNAPLESILAVGAAYNNRGLSPKDQGCLAHTLALCLAQGSTVAPDSSLTVIQRGDDFLATTQGVKADVVMICFVIDPNPPEAEYIALNNQNDPGLRANSHDSDERWSQALESTGAKLIVSFRQSDLEVSCRDFAALMRKYRDIGSCSVQSSNRDIRKYSVDTLVHTDLLPKRETRWHSLLRRFKESLSRS